MKYRGVFGTITTMVRTEGPRSLYNGLVAGLQRQMSFASVRIGLYDSMKQFYTRGSESECCITHMCLWRLITPPYNLEVIGIICQEKYLTTWMFGGGLGINIGCTMM